MTEVTTSPVRGDTARAEWRAFRRFVARPVLPERTARFSAGAAAALVRMYALDVLLMAVLALTAGAVMAAGFELPETALAEMEITAGVALAVVVGAPLMEEIVFRGWLSGRARHLLAIASLLFAGAAAAAIMGTGIPGTGVWALAALAIFGLLAAWLSWSGRRKPPMRWFRRLFPVFFWLSTLAFACIHLLNFSEGALWVLLPLVLPQFILGAILGYLRVYYGLWASIALHAMHNGTALGLVYLGTRYATGA
ncbi:type II CAAX prenyl endopeptidase Rce1 family protein [Qipengyuania sp. MTN3-11]|uniref:CPBP family glutamic-type intramembrane protease n=1 Tax=Qipengyuania sp. MTN3-11 TaxID=3056557 RepID=UPI0036F42FD0